MIINKKIMFIGELNPYSRTCQRKRVIEELGYNIYAYSTAPADITLDGKKSLIKSFRWKIGLPSDITRINKVLLMQETNRQCPDLIWIEKGNTIYPWTLWLLKKRFQNVKIVSYLEDDMFALHNRSWYFTYGLKYYDYIFTTKSFNCRENELQAFGAKNINFINNAYDLYVHRPLLITNIEEETLGVDVGFIGTYEEERAKSILYIAKHGIKIRIWGNGWKPLKDKYSNLIIENKAIYGDTYAKAISATKINLCFLRKANRDQQTSRSVEIPACGGFMLAERTKEHLSLFKEKAEAEYFSSDTELLEKIKYYLNNEKERKIIAEAGRQRCVLSKYDHQSLIKNILQKIFS